MYEAYRNGYFENIQGVSCQLPRPGYVRDYFTGEEKYVGIYKRAAKPKDQYWQRQPLPAWWDERRADEEKRQKRDPDYVDVELENFRAQEWGRRLEGFWFLNKGEPVYLTGLHYYYLQWLPIGADDNDGYPSFWESDRQFFYVLQYVIEDPDCFGLLYVTKRREGKTSKSIGFLLEPLTRLAGERGGIQSKTETDAKKIVFKKLKEAYRRLPDFFQPVFDLAQGSDPKTELIFREQARRGKAALTQLGKSDSLNSGIDWRSSSEEAYDGDKLLRYIGDEIFKTRKVDVIERHRIVRRCVLNQDSRVRGKILYTSTVEEIEGDGEAIDEYIRLWEDSDPAKRHPKTRRTPSGLLRYFLPADEARLRDRYGYCDKEANREMILAERPEPGSRDYYSEVRKEPLSIEEAFRVARNECMFDAERINNQIDRVSWQDKDLIMQGNFVWAEGQKDKRVEFHPSNTGRWKVLHLFEEHSNKVSWRGSIPVPSNQRRFVIGVDPYDHDVVEAGHRSQAAAYVLKKYDLNDPQYSRTFIVEYVARPKKAKIFYEDMIKTCFYFSAPLLFEDNKKGLQHYFEERGYLHFLITMPNRKDPGIPASTRTHQELSEAIEAYVSESCSKVFFAGLLRDWLRFDITKTRKYDRAMASGYTLLGDERILYAAKNERTREVGTVFRKYKIARSG